MRKFLINITLFLLTFLIVILIIFTYFDYYGYSDAYYKRIVSDKQTSLIVGTSRAAQALQPHIIDSILSGSAYSLPIYNFSFTVSISPYGKLYYEAIKNKVRKDNNKGIFIVTVDPFSLAIDTSNVQWDKNVLREQNYHLAKIRFHTKPSYEYLINYCRPNKWVNNNHVYLHDNGWLEVSPPSMDSLSVAYNIELKMKDYYQRKIQKSNYRIYYLEKTIKYLKMYGDVFIVRLPVSTPMQELENILWNDFNDDMIGIANKYHLQYYSFSTDSDLYQTTDGNHLYKTSGADVSRKIATLILNRHYP